MVGIETLTLPLFTINFMTLKNLRVVQHILKHPTRLGYLNQYKHPYITIESQKKY